MKKGRIVLSTICIIILLLLIGVCCYFVYYFLDLSRQNTDIDELIINNKTNVDYNVLLKSNTYYEKDDIGSTYITNNINKINVYFNYNQTFSSLVNGKYNYYIIGSLIVNNKNKPEENLINKVLEKTNNKEVELNNNLINISENININFSNNLEYLTKLKEHIDSSIELDSYIEYKLIVNYNVDESIIHNPFTKNAELYIKIPIDNTTSIITSSNVISQTKEFSNSKNKRRNVFYAITLEFLGAIFLIILVIYSIIKNLFYHNDYEVMVNKILKKYKLHIVDISKLPDLSKLEVLFVNSFDDLLDVSYNMNLPINHVEVIKGKENAFIVMNKEVAYVYKLSIRELF